MLADALQLFGTPFSRSAAVLALHERISEGEATKEGVVQIYNNKNRAPPFHQIFGLSIMVQHSLLYSLTIQMKNKN
jgi:hypothetical protein